MQMCHRWAGPERESGVRVGRPKQTKVDAEFEEEFFFVSACFSFRFTLMELKDILQERNSLKVSHSKCKNITLK